jgi:hypothetical protein
MWRGIKSALPDPSQNMSYFKQKNLEIKLRRRDSNCRCWGNSDAQYYSPRVTVHKNSTMGHSKDDYFVSYLSANEIKTDVRKTVAAASSF